MNPFTVQGKAIPSSLGEKIIEELVGRERAQTNRKSAMITETNHCQKGLGV